MKIAFLAKNDFVLFGATGPVSTLQAIPMVPSKLREALHVYEGEQVQVFLANTEETKVFAELYGIRGSVADAHDLLSLYEAMQESNVESVTFSPRYPKASDPTIPAPPPEPETSKQKPARKA